MMCGRRTVAVMIGFRKSNKNSLQRREGANRASRKSSIPYIRTVPSDQWISDKFAAFFFSESIRFVPGATKYVLCYWKQALDIQGDTLDIQGDTLLTI